MENEKFIDEGKMMYHNFVQVTLEHPYVLALIKKNHQQQLRLCCWSV
ncbi:MAG: hypothetical protein IKU66_07000 [Clostridia bacterium]|nr:hypothetical protein [Clostridia bacterium]